MRDGLAVELDVPGGGPGHVLDRGHPAQHLLDGQRQSLALGGQERELVGVGEQLVHAAADDVAGGLVTADEDQERLVDDRGLVEPVPVDLGVDQGADEVVGLVVPPALLDHRR